VPWVTVHGMKVNHTDLELFQLMKAAGCKRVGFGVENGDENMLRNVIRKGQTLDQVREAFRQCQGGRVCRRWASSSSACPATTKRRWRRRSSLALELDPKLANFMLAAPFPGTVMYDRSRKAARSSPTTGATSPSTIRRSRFKMNENYDPIWSSRSGARPIGASISTGPERVVEKMMFKENWTNLPGTFAQIKRFFIGAKDQEAPAEKVQKVAARRLTEPHARTDTQTAPLLGFRTFGWPAVKPFSVVISVSAFAATPSAAPAMCGANPTTI
jgi:hypothetical protein